MNPVTDLKPAMHAVDKFFYTQIQNHLSIPLSSYLSRQKEQFLLFILKFRREFLWKEVFGIAYSLNAYYFFVLINSYWYLPHILFPIVWNTLISTSHIASEHIFFDNSLTNMTLSFLLHQPVIGIFDIFFSHLFKIR